MDPELAIHRTFRQLASAVTHAEGLADSLVSSFLATA